jgi:hypothetical protein
MEFDQLKLSEIIINAYNAGYGDAKCNHINDSLNYVNEISYLNDEDNSHTKKDETETWDDIEDFWLTDNYPPFGGPFTDAITFIDWLKIYYSTPKLKNK